MKFLLCAICMIVSIMIFSPFEANPRWKEQYLKGLTEKEIIQFLGMPDDKNLFKGYMSWYDYRSHKKLKVMFMMPNFPKNYKQMSEEERMAFWDNYDANPPILFVNYVEITNIPFKTKIINREEKLLKILKNKSEGYSIFIE